MAGLLNIGLTGLSAAQSQLSTTSHNITNASTAGYHRQVLTQSTQNPSFSGIGFFGNGTRIAAITRSYNQFLEGQVTLADNRRAEYATYNRQISQINAMLANADSGLSSSMASFFAGVQEVATNPTSIAARQALLSNAQALVNRFQTMDGRLSEVRQSVEGEIAATVEQINTYGSAIADMNQRIVLAQAAGAGMPANDLLDQRGKLLVELNRLVKVSTTQEQDGSVSVFIGSGQNLVMGLRATPLTTVPDANNPQRSSIAIVAPNGNKIVLPDRLLNGGALGGLLGFRSESLDPAQNRLGLMAVTLATAFNEQHKLGVDLNGMLGRDMFTVTPPRVEPSAAATVAIDPANLGKLTDSDYELRNVGGTLSLRRLSDNVEFAPSGAPPTFAVEGLTISAINLAPGQVALIQPTRFAAQGISLALNDARQIAAGNPVSASVPTSNGGNGRIEGIVVRSVLGMDQLPAAPAPDGVPDFASFDLVFNSASGSFALPAGYTTVPAAAELAFNPASDAVGKSFTLRSAAGFEFSFTIAGVPQDGDRFSIAPTSQGTADNRNASLLGALQTTKLMFDAGPAGGSAPTATLGNSYAQLVSTIGNKTREVQVNEAAQVALLAQAEDARDSMSGVNLDEEAANLVRYQQAYQAAGRVMAVAQRLFDELLSISR